MPCVSEAENARSVCSPHFLERFGPLGRIRHVLDALIRELSEDDVGSHTTLPSQLPESNARRGYQRWSDCGSRPLRFNSAKEGVPW